MLKRIMQAIGITTTVIMAYHACTAVAVGWRATAAITAVVIGTMAGMSLLAPHADAIMRRLEEAA